MLSFMDRFMVVDYADHHAVADRATPPGEGDECDHGAVVWRGEMFDRSDADAQETSARVAERECTARNLEAIGQRERKAPPSLELNEDGSLPESTAEVAPAPEAQQAAFDHATLVAEPSEVV